MNCQNCGKKFDVRSFNAVVNGMRVNMNLCNECAGKLGLNVHEVQLDRDPYFTAFFSGESKKKRECQTCGTTEEQFLSTGFVGCSDCYYVFSDVQKTAEAYHGKAKHTGKQAKM